MQGLGELCMPLLFSLISIANRYHVEPLAYLTDVTELITRLPATPISQLTQFLLDHWQPRHA